jgi:alpha-D-ribose 1-methylphosphonate 5-triphosphate synthase subunit PhnH
MSGHAFGSGFADPVHSAQSVFRSVLDALANPGTVEALSADTEGTEGLTPELAALLLTLCDHDTSVWLSPALQTRTVADFIGFHTGAPVVTELATVQFALVAQGDALPELARCNAGTQDYPDRATTIVKHVESLAGGVELELRGPGIRDVATIAPLGLPADFVAQWAENRAIFPRGVDLILVSSRQVLGLPRSTRIEGA